MKNKLFFLLLALLAAFAIPAQAQRSINFFGAPRTVIASAPQNLTAASGSVTNTIDLLAFDGIVSVDIFSCTNTGTTGGTLTATLYGSNDQTNLTAISYALATATSVSYTNRFYGGPNLTATDVYLLPGTWTTPATATAGWATPYLVEAPMTNTAALTVTSRNFYHLGISAADSGRYLHIVWTPGGTATNFTVGATVTGATHSGQLY